MSTELLLREFDRLITKPEHVTALRQSIFDLALTGRLVKASDSDGDAVELIAAARAARHDSDDRTRKRPGRSGLATVAGHRLPTLPESWRWARLDEIAAIVGGVTKDDKNQRLPGLIEVPYLRVANVQRGYLDLAKIATINVSPETASYLQLLPGDILFNEGGDRDKLGRGWIWEGQIERCIHQNHVFRARLYAPIVDPRIISWHGNTFGQKWFIQGGKQTTNLASVNKTTLSAFPVPIPPLAQQHRIVAKVNELMAVCDKLEAAHEHRERRRKQLSAASLARLTAAENLPASVAEKDVTFLLSHSGRMMTRSAHVAGVRRAILDLAVQGQLNGEGAREWPKRTIAEVLDSLQTGPFGSSLHQTDYEMGGTPVINPASIQDGRIVPLPKMAVGPAVLDRLASFRVSSNDIVMARRGEMGRCAVVTPREHGWLCGTGCLVLHPVQGMFPQYLAMFIGAPRTRQHLNSASVGTTMQNLNQRILLRLEVVVPPFEEQQRIVKKVEELMAVCDELERSLEATEAGRTRALEAVLHGVLDEAPVPLPTLLTVAH